MKRLIVFAMMIVLAVAVQANAGNMYGGIKGGANWGDLSDIDGSSMRTGFQGGLFVGTHVNEEFGFRVEGLWVQKGAEGSFLSAEDAEVHEGTLKLDYIEFPLLFSYDLKAGESLGLNLFAGPTIGFNIGADLELDEHGTTDVKDDIESFEFGAAIGAGIAKTMASGKSIGLDIRYSLGATTIFKDTVDGAPEPKNRGVGLMAFFQIPMGAQQ